MAVSSANRTSMPPATTAQQAYEQLGESVAVYLDAGPVPIGEPSSIVDLTGPQPRLVRAGAVTAAALQEVVPTLVTAEQ
jgi:tRNA A37 threonylcarbamoyladenosine synthetase subunit TsaC/SUA5/YrdC